MIIYIPTWGQGVPVKTFDNVSRQNGITEIIEAAHFEKFERGDMRRYQAIGKAREKIFSMIIYNYDEFFGMQNDNIIHRDNDNYMQMYNFLKKNPKWAGVSMTHRKTKNIEPNHPVIDCCVFRSAVMLNFKFDVPFGSCECKPLIKKIRAMDWKFGYFKTGTQTIIKERR